MPPLSSVLEKVSDTTLDVNDLSLWVAREISEKAIVTSWFQRLVGRCFGVVHCIQCAGSQVLYLDMHEVRAWRERNKALVLTSETVSAMVDPKTVAATTRSERKWISRFIVMQNKAYSAFQKVYPQDKRIDQQHYDAEIPNARDEILSVINGAKYFGRSSATIKLDKLGVFFQIENAKLTRKNLIEGLELPQKGGSEPLLTREIRVIQERFPSSTAWWS